MITEHDLIEAIAECQGERNPNANTCIKLAAYLTIKRELYGDPEAGISKMETPASYSYASEPAETPEINYDSGTEFSEAIRGRAPDDIWPIIDELMSTIQITMPRLYTSAMNRLQA